MARPPRHGARAGKLIQVRVTQDEYDAIVARTTPGRLSQNVRASLLDTNNTHSTNNHETFGPVLDRMEKTLCERKLATNRNLEHIAMLRNLLL